MTILKLITDNEKFLEALEAAGIFKKFFITGDEEFLNAIAQSEQFEKISQKDKYNTQLIAKFIQDNFIEKRSDDEAQLDGFIKIHINPDVPQQLAGHGILDPQQLLIELLELIRAYEVYQDERNEVDFSNARMSKSFDTIEIPIKYGIDKKASESYELTGRTSPLLSVEFNEVTRQESAEFSVAPQSGSALIDTLSTTPLKFLEAVRLVNELEYVERISDYIKRTGTSSQLIERQNAEILLLASLSTESQVALHHLALQYLPHLHAGIAHLEEGHRINIWYYLFEIKDEYDKDINTIIYQFLQPYVTGDNVHKLFHDAYKNKIQWGNVSAAQFLSLKNKFWPSWPEELTASFFPVTPWVNSFIRHHFNLLSVKEKAEIIVDYLSLENPTKLLDEGYLTTRALFDELKINNNGLLTKLLNKVVKFGFMVTHLQGLHTIVTSYRDHHLKWKKRESNALIRCLINFSCLANNRDLNCTQKISLYYILYPYMEKYDTWLLFKPALACRLQDL